MSAGQPRDRLGRFGITAHPESGIVLGGEDDEEGSPGGTRQIDKGLVRARNVLLAGLVALGPQREAITVVGAQAVFEHIKGREDIPFTLTLDGDTSIAPSLVDPAHDIGQAMRDAGFVAHRDRPGIWGLPGLRTGTIGFDLLVPGALAGPGRRGARVPNQDKHAIGRADGLEMSVIDRDKRLIEPLDGSGRSVDAYVAGPAALLCAKAYKLHERLAERARGGRDRVKPKNAGDAWRLMAVADPSEARSAFARCGRHDVLGPPIVRGRAYLDALFGPGGQGTVLAVADVGDEVGHDLVAETITAWMRGFRAE